MPDTEAAESGTVEDTTAAHEAAVSSQNTRDWESEAREMGWVPEEEFTGDRRPAKFKSAQEFVEDMPPYVRKLLEKQETKFNDRITKIEKINDRNVARLTTIHKQEIESLKTERRAAIKEGDADKVEELDGKIDALKENAPDKDGSDAETIDAAFAKRNTWYGEDDDLTAMAIRESEAISKAYTLKHKQPIPDTELIDKVEKRVKASAEYREKFPNDKPAANGHAAVDGGGEGAGFRRGSKGFADLPAEAKRAYDGYDPRIKKELTKEQFAKEYWADA